MDKSEGSGVCDFQDRECGDGFTKRKEQDTESKSSKKDEAQKDEGKKEQTKEQPKQLSQEKTDKKFGDVTGVTTGVPILDSIAANDLKNKEEQLSNQRINMNKAMDVNDALNREKEKTEQKNKDVNQNL